MDFLTFFIYFMVSNVIYTAAFIGAKLLYMKYQQKKFEKHLKNGNIKIVKMEDLIGTPDDDKTWN